MKGKLRNILKQLVRNDMHNLIVAGANDLNVLLAAQQAEKSGVVKPLFLGNKEKIASLISNNNLEFKNSEIIDMPVLADMVKLASDMHYSGKKCILMKGKVTTADIMKQIIRNDFKLKTEKFLSHIAIFDIPDYHKLLALSDSAMNISPDINQKKLIIENGVEVLYKLGINLPKIACLSALENINSKIVATTDAAELKIMNSKGLIKNCIVDGPLAFDNAISKKAADIKNINSKVAGDADMLLVPEINSGNMLYKALNYFANATCAGIIYGAKIPLVITSRTDKLENKYCSILLSCLF